MSKREIVALGVVLLLLPVLVILVLPKPDGAMWIMLKLVSAVGAGLAAGAFLGSMNLTAPVLKGTVEAGGGFAVFLIVFMLNPPGWAAVQRAQLIGASAPPSVIGVAGSKRFDSMHSAAARRLGFMDWMHAEVSASQEERETILNSK